MDLFTKKNNKSIYSERAVDVCYFAAKAVRSCLEDNGTEIHKCEFMWDMLSYCLRSKILSKETERMAGNSKAWPAIILSTTIQDQGMESAIITNSLPHESRVKAQIIDDRIMKIGGSDYDVCRIASKYRKECFNERGPIGKCQYLYDLVQECKKRGVSRDALTAAANEPWSSVIEK